MTARWQYKVVVLDTPGRGMTAFKPEFVEAALDQHGAQGWELTAIYQPPTMNPIWLYLKKPA